ncbi:MAG TPA: IclR family transcriptional regulator C-terminal domain-containing protein [Burkholderiales bacterium]|nr:IclR family transcriptional regulator C-terminal domain-containing protein [Burkholderiales bacterium]
MADPNYMASLARGLEVMRGFSREKRQMSIAQLSQKTGIPRASVRRCLYTLAQLGYVASPDGRSYSLQPKVLGLGHAYLSSTPMVVAAQPFLDRVSEAVNESCSLAVLDGEDILYLARSVTSRIISVTLNVGSRLPAHCTSIGYGLLANLPPRELDQWLAKAELKPFTERTLTSKEKLREQLAQVREADYAIADRLMELAVRSIAVPVRNSAGTVVAGINVIVEAGRVSLRDMRTLYLPHLQAAAAELGAQLVP